MIADAQRRGSTSDTKATDSCGLVISARMKALLLFLAFAACVYAHCPAKEYWHRYYYVRGKAKVKLRSQEVTEGLRVEFVSNCKLNWVPHIGKHQHIRSSCTGI